MEHLSTWAKLRAGKAAQVTGLKNLQLAYTQEPYPSQAMELGVGLLWLRKYDLAAKHFDSVIAGDPKCGDNDYGMAGVARWCLGKPNEAVRIWNAGLNAKYARASGLGIIMPLLLYFASAIKPEIAGRVSAIKLIQEKTGDTRIKNWPGPIAKWLIGQMTEAALRDYCQSLNPKEKSDSLWLFEIYKNLTAYNPISPSEIRASMRKLTDASTTEWQDEDVLLGRIWHEEFFLARFIAETT